MTSSTESNREPFAAITFLRYEEMAVGERFYEQTLGLPLVDDQDWAKVYRIGPGAYVGLVSARKRPLEKPVGQGVLLSITVPAKEDVDRRFDQLRKTPGVEILNEPGMVEALPVYSFFLLDPGGYHLEIQAFTTEEAIGKYS